MADTSGKILYLIKKPKCLLGFFVLSILMLVYWYSATVSTTAINYLSHLKYVPVATFIKNYKKSSTKYILYWNTVFGAKDMYLGIGSKIFEKCEVKSCFATANKSLKPVEQFDAVVFHGPRYSTLFDGVPGKRSVHQRYIFYSLESPFNCNFDNNALVNFYNWTMTYRKDSDIFNPYAMIERKRTNYTLPTEAQIKHKTKLVGWFVSNCNERAKRRMSYAKELAKYIPVDIYGACGTLSCHNRSACYKMLERDYKFYLSFENSMCNDYITEKMFNILQYNVVPVVLGYSDYNASAPPRSVINTQDFRSPKELAAYLRKLDKDDAEYLRYFEWKKRYVVRSSTQAALCKLCQLLNRPLSYSSYGNIRDWFFGFTCVA